MKPRKKTAILVAGMHRSGTSALAGALKLTGVSLGRRLLEPGQDNPKGYWEHRDAVVIHEQLLEALGRRWDDVRPLPDKWMLSDAAQMARSQIADLIQREFEDAEVWAVKDPRMCRLLPLWIEVLRECEIRAVTLMAVRAPSEVAASIQARNHWALPIGELLWLRHVIEAESASRQVERTALLYEDLIADPSATITRALARVDVHLPFNSAVDEGALTKFVDRADRHHVHQALSGNDSPLFPIVEKAYKALSRIAHEDDDRSWASLAECAGALEIEWGKYGSVVSAVAEMAYKFSVGEARARAEISDVASKLNAQISWSEEAAQNLRNLREERDRIVSERDMVCEELGRIQSERDQVRDELSKIRNDLDYAHHELRQLRNHLEEVCNERDQMGRGLTIAMERSAGLEFANDKLRKELDAVQGSWSWRMMGPFRAMARAIKMVAR
ncbi:hypothetical protein [Dyella choica]|uniref:Sulfotransferase family protein n=1 Tax=Dyella choica TaxID=1927959 RepID=A0A3S0PH54_9GAMM|nr:hypothetical protein [Dyella choica]RUL73091.1 hypothetical protein EKH80_15625 [Dyella choica]